MKIDRRSFLVASSSALVLGKGKLSPTAYEQPSVTPEPPGLERIEARDVAVYTTADKTNYRLSPTDKLTFKPMVQPVVQSLASIAIEEDNKRIAPRWKTETVLLSVRDQLLHEVQQGVGAGRTPYLGDQHSDRADGDADMGVVHLLRRRRARLPQEL